jgi:hypothetical protein
LPEPVIPWSRVTPNFFREPSVDRRHGRGLLRIQHVRLGGNQLARSMVVRIGHAIQPAGLLADDTPLRHRGHHGRAEVEPVEHQRLLHRPELLLEKLIKLRLLRSAAGQGGEFVGCKAPGQGEKFLLLQARSAAHRGGDHRLNDAVEPARVVARHPAGEFEQVGRQRREGINHLDDGLQLFDRVVRGRANLPDDAEVHRPAHRHPDERTHRHLVAQRSRDLVVQELVEPRERVHADDHDRMTAPAPDLGKPEANVGVDSGPRPPI